MRFNTDFSQHVGEICGTKNAEMFQPSSSSCISEIVHDFPAKKHAFRAGNCMEQPWDKCKFFQPSSSSNFYEFACDFSTRDHHLGAGSCMVQ
jgi:hypothetical protein